MKMLFEAKRILGYNIYVPDAVIFSLNPREGCVWISTCLLTVSTGIFQTHLKHTFVVLKLKLNNNNKKLQPIIVQWSESLGGAAGAESSSLAMKAIYLIERSGISRSFKWISHISKHGNDRKCQVTSTRDVCAQTKARLSDSRAPDSAEEHRPSPARAPQLTPSCYFHVQRELATSSPPCSAMTSKLLFGYDHLSGNRPFPSLCLNRCSMLWSWRVVVGGYWSRSWRQRLNGRAPFWYGHKKKKPSWNYAGQQRWEVSTLLQTFVKFLKLNFFGV